jgi:hypothetical protein
MQVGTKSANIGLGSVSALFGHFGALYRKTHAILLRVVLHIARVG